MKRKYGKSLVLAVLTFSLAGPALAILGLGDIVFDPTSYGELIKQLLQMQQQYSQLVQTYQLIQSQYQQMLFMAQREFPTPCKSSKPGCRREPEERRRCRGKYSSDSRPGWRSFPPSSIPE